MNWNRIDLIASLRRVAVVLASIAMAGLTACAATPSAPRAITLDGIVVDAQRPARPDEAGLVRVQRGGGWMDGQAHMTLQPGDLVVTAPNAYAVIRYPSGTELFMRPGTRGRIGSFTELVGEVFAKIRGAFAIQTTFVNAGAEGTAYLVRSSPAGEATVVVFDGSVNVSSTTGAWPAYRVGAGAMSVAWPGLTQPQPTRVPPDELAHTRAWVERMEQLAPPPRQASNLGTGLAIAGLVAIIAASASRDDDRSRDSGSMEAPSRTAPGSPTAERPALFQDCRTVALAWSAVQGARDYAVTLDAAPHQNPTAWHRTGSPVSTSIRLAIGHELQPGNLYRWVVRARDAQGRTGPASSPLYFACVSEPRIR